MEGEEGGEQRSGEGGGKGEGMHATVCEQSLSAAVAVLGISMHLCLHLGSATKKPFGSIPVMFLEVWRDGI